jgi:hypothetical protein
MAEIATPETNDTGRRLTTLEVLVADLAAKNKPWYLDAGTLISLLALVLSLIAFGYTSYREINKERDQQSQEFQSTIVELNSLSTQWSELFLKYQKDPDYYNTVDPSIRAQISLIGAKAYTLLAVLGDQVSALDAAVVANALQTTGDYTAGANVLKKAIPQAKNPTEYVVITRMLGNFSYYQGNIDDGNKYFSMAVQVFDKFPNTGTNQQEINFDKAQNEVYWALAAALHQQCPLAQQNLLEVNKYLATMAASASAAGGPGAIFNPFSQMIQQISTSCPAGQ